MFLYIVTGVTLSFLSSLALLASWCLIPRWRTLLNYVSLNQVVIGTLHQFCTIVLSDVLAERSMDIFILLNDYLFLASLCWSLCASMVTYLKLVLAYPGKMSCEKRKATMFTYGVLLVTKSVTDGAVPAAFGLTEYSQLLPVRFMLMYVVVAVNLYAFAAAALQVRRRRAPGSPRAPGAPRSPGARSPALPLVGAGAVCDALTALAMSAVFIAFYKHKLLFWIGFFYFRLVPQAIVVLFNERSRDIWCKYLAQRRNVRSHVVDIRNQ